MKPKDIFLLAVRILGLVFIYHGLLALPGVIPFIFADTIRGFVMALIMAAWPLAVGWWLLGGAVPLVKRAYPDAPNDAPLNVPGK